MSDAGRVSSAALRPCRRISSLSVGNFSLSAATRYQIQQLLATVSTVASRGLRSAGEQRRRDTLAANDVVGAVGAVVYRELLQLIR